LLEYELTNKPLCKNLMGLAEFPEGDPATFDDKSKDYYDRLDSLN
jgi:hypothetical protein